MRGFIFRSGQRGVLLLLIGLALVCCWDSESGYVTIHLMSMINPQNALYLDLAQISGLGDRVIHQKVGTFSLTNGGSWVSGKTYCELQIRKDRITVVTIRIVNSEPHCECEIRAPGSTLDKPICM
jgi:hypothetical protein